MARKLILYELNEVPFRVIDEYVRRHPNSTLARVLPRMDQFETKTCDSKLSPWVTWPTMHRGVSDTEHGIQNFGQDLTAIDSRFPPIWQVLRRAGLNVGVFASLHTSPAPEDIKSYAFYVPDPFAATDECHPVSISAYQRFNLAMSRDSYRNVGRKIRFDSMGRLAATFPFIGIRIRTILDAVRQLGEERLSPWKRVRRRTYQTVFGFDVFMNQVEKSRPDFATFFTNHAASAMHRYWAATYPGDYVAPGRLLEYDAEWIARYRQEIDFAMLKFDEELKRLLAFADSHDTCVWIASSMGQAAAHGTKISTQLYVEDMTKFMLALGVSRVHWEERPAMAPDRSVVVSAAIADEFERSVKTASVAGVPLSYERADEGFFSVSLGHANLPREIRFLDIKGQACSFEDAGLRNLEIEDEAGSTAYHVPTGILLKYDPAQRVHRRADRSTVDTRDLFPAILTRFGVSLPVYARGSAFG